jgi:hypothetical protein
MAVKSPFLVKQDFLSPLLCEEIVYNLNFLYPDTDPDGRPTKTMKSHEPSEDIIFEKIQEAIPEIESHYEVAYRGTVPMTFEWYLEDCKGEPPHCENSNRSKGKWIRIYDKDLSAVIFMCDYHEKTPFDNDFEVYGGKLEFAQHDFGFNPQRGTMVVFPSGPHFINATSHILAGELFQVRLHFATMMPYVYDPVKFPGDYTIWFDEIA